MDEVAALPGGQGLAALAGRVVTARPAAVREIADRWRRAAGRGADSGEAVARAVARLDGAWEGASADGFVAYMGEFARAGGAVNDALTAAAGDLDSAAAALESAKSSVGRICGDLLDRVRRQAPGEDGAIRAMCAEAEGDARPVVERAEAALSGALAALRGRAAITPAFSTMADPEVQAFVPAPGRPVEWHPTPGAGPADAGPPAPGGSGGPSGGGPRAGAGPAEG